jgi:D-threo-aldose 1-dehydrogenase
VTFEAIAWPRVGVGCASLAAPSVSERDADATLARAIERGVRFFDVAPLYGGGLGEVRLGRALRALPRSEYVLCTKVGVTRPYGEPPTPRGSSTPRSGDRWDYSRAATRASIELSLERLGVVHIDVVHLHDVEDHLDACLEAHAELEALRQEHKVGMIGIGSNLVAPVAKLIGRERFDAFLLAGRYTLLDDSGAALIADAARRGIGVIAGGAFNSGILARWPQPAPSYGYRPASPAVVERTARIAAIAARHGVPLPTAALQYVARNRAILTVLLGPRSADELDASLDALDADVPPELWEDLAAERDAARAETQPS